jgi:hypothetical protein
MAETSEARWQRLERQAARDRQRRADGFCPVPLRPMGIMPDVFRLSVDSRRPGLGQIDTYVCPRCDTHLVREGPGEPWRVLTSISEG